MTPHQLRLVTVLLVTLALTVAVVTVGSAQSSASYEITVGGVNYGADLFENFVANAGGPGINLFQYTLAVPKGPPPLPNFSPQSQIVQLVITNPDGLTGTMTNNLGWAQTDAGGPWTWTRVAGTPTVDGLSGVFTILVPAVERTVDATPTFLVAGTQTKPILGPRLASSVPEPSSLALLSMAGVGLLPMMRRRKRR